MKRISSVILLLLFMIALVSCSENRQAEAPTINQQQSESSDAPADAGSETPDVGTTETFTYGELVLEVTNVHETRTESKLAEGIEPYEETVFTCGPGAKINVINADMSDPTLSEDQKAHAQWGVYDFESDSRVRITDELSTIDLDETTDCVFNLESSIAVLSFEFTA